MKYTVDTKVHFGTSLGREKQHQDFTLEELGFDQEELNNKTEEQIEDEIQQMFNDWEANHLDSGWSLVED